jgi:putative PIN family toxin of toxin-antitoxin system
MANPSTLRLVIDTNIVLEGLTQQESASGLIIDAWLAKLFTVHVSTAIAYEYQDVLARKLSPSRWNTLKPVLVTLLSYANFTEIYFTWRPASPDPGDDLVIDCAMNANAAIVTANLRDFQQAKQSLGLKIFSPVELILKLTGDH